MTNTKQICSISMLFFFFIHVMVWEIIMPTANGLGGGAILDRAGGRKRKLEYKSEKHEQFWKEDNTADDCGRNSTNQNGAGTYILHIANSIILFRLYDIG